MESTRGMHGGYRLLRKPTEITLLDVLTSIQGNAQLSACAIDHRRCQQSARCAVHQVWVDIRREVDRRLGTRTIASLL